MLSSGCRPNKRLNRVGLTISSISNGYCYLTINVEKQLSTLVGLRIYQLNGKAMRNSYSSDFRPLTNRKNGIYHPDVAPSAYSPIIVTSCQILQKDIDKDAPPVHLINKDHDPFRDSVIKVKLITPGKVGARIRFKVDILKLVDPDEFNESIFLDDYKRENANLKKELLKMSYIAGINTFNKVPPPCLCKNFQWTLLRSL